MSRSSLPTRKTSIATLLLGVVSVLFATLILPSCGAPDRIQLISHDAGAERLAGFPPTSDASAERRDTTPVRCADPRRCETECDGSALLPFRDALLSGATRAELENLAQNVGRINVRSDAPQEALRGQALGSVFRIAPTHVLTNAHVVLPRDLSRNLNRELPWRTADEVCAAISVTFDTAGGSVRCARVIAAPVVDGNGVERDLAILELDRSPSDASPLVVSRVPPTAGSRVIVLGYRAGVSLSAAEGSLIRYDGVWGLHSASSRYGMSGSPVFFPQNGRLVVGLAHAEGGCGADSLDPGDRYNRAVRLDDLALVSDTTPTMPPPVSPPTCTSGTPCGGRCVDLNADMMNCGVCGRACATGQRCEGGLCRPSCSPGQTQCVGACVDTSRDPAHCGACGRACASLPHAIPACVGGSCTSACAAGFADCDGNTRNGCESDLSSPATCGGCVPRLEVCGNNRDDNCDGRSDEACPVAIALSRESRTSFMVGGRQGQRTQELACPSGFVVTGASGWLMDRSYLSALRLRCGRPTLGPAPDYQVRIASEIETALVGGGDILRAWTIACPAGYIATRMFARAGRYVDGIGLYCARLAAQQTGPDTWSLATLDAPPPTYVGSPGGGLFDEPPPNLGGPPAVDGVTLNFTHWADGIAWRYRSITLSTR